MSFIWPAMLAGLLLVPLCVAVYARRLRQRQQLAARYGSLGLVQTVSGGRLTWQRHLPAGLFLAGLAILIVALARPEATVSLPRIEGTVLLAFDASGSMGATDIEPTRMEAAKAAARAFVERQPQTVLVGVVVFSDSGFAIQAPSAERDDILAAIDRLAPERGTSLGSGILAAINALEAGAVDDASADPAAPPAPTPTPLPPGTYSSAMIVLLTDGENNIPPDPLAAAQLAADRGVRIYTVGVGSPAGADLEIDGFVVHTQLDEALLQMIAQITGGAYYNAADEDDLQAIYSDIDPQLVIKPEKMEVTSLLAGASLLVWLVGGAFSLAWFGRLP